MKKIVKKLLPLTLSFTIIGTSSIAIATTNSENTELQNAYNNVSSYANENDIPFTMNYSEFSNDYLESNFSEPNLYENEILNILQPQIAPYSNGSSAYYYNTGQICPSSAKYSKYNLINIVQKGDIVYEANGGFGITGHAAIVEGLFYDTTQRKWYVRLIEAIDVGVCRSILDDTRVDDKGVSIYRVNNASSTNKINAVSFCIGELGSSYSIDFAKDTSSSETDWYCSELVWAAYKNVGFDIETTGSINEPGVTPRDITVNGRGVTKIF